MNTNSSPRNEWAKGPKFRVSLFASFVLTFLSAGSLFAQQPFVPNDPYFYTNNPAGSLGQWYLDKQTSGAAVDINVQGAWQRGLTGQGVTIADIALGGLEYTHPDLISNYRAVDSWNFVDNNSDASATTAELSNVDTAHENAVAGLAAGRGGNGIGITGVAPYASFSQLKISNNGKIYLQFGPGAGWLANAIRYHSTEVTSPIAIKMIEIQTKEMFYGQNMPSSTVSLIDQAMIDSTQAGTMIVVPAANFRTGESKITKYGQTQIEWANGDSNKSAFCHLPQAIVVAALNSQGTFASYSNYGSCITATVPSGETIWNGGVGVTTADLQGANGYNPGMNDTFPDQNYTSVFTGTSAAAPLMAGVLALTKQAQPNLDTRFAKHLLAKTCRVVDPSDSTPMGGWTTNAAGYHFNNNYGFGLVDADVMTLVATQYSGVTPLTTIETGTVTVGKQILFDSTPVTQTFTLTSGGHLEEILVHLNLHDDSSYYGIVTGNLEATLTSPSGTESLLFYHDLHGLRQFGEHTLDWTLTDNAFWGEDAVGMWAITIWDTQTRPDEDQSVPTYWDSFSITGRFGDLIPVPEPGTLTLCASALVAGLVFWHRRQRFASVSNV
jgi:hypothetical protein